MSRGKPMPHSLPDEKKKEVGLTRETWKLEVISDPENPVKLGKQLTKSDGTALDFAALMKLAEKHAVRFAKVMTCLNIGCPLGMGIWEGVPLREVVWLTKPREDVRRVFYYGYHNDDPKQMFQARCRSAACSKIRSTCRRSSCATSSTAQWLTAERGGPVRIVVPEAYGFKSIKWLSHVVLTPTCATPTTPTPTQNNDVDSPLKTFAATLSVPTRGEGQDPDPGHRLCAGRHLGLVEGAGLDYAGQQGVAEGRSVFHDRAVDRRGHSSAAGSGAASCRATRSRRTRSASTRPASRRRGRCGWRKPLGRAPSRLARRRLHAALPHHRRERAAQPMPRPFKKSGRCDIESVKITVG